VAAGSLLSGALLAVGRLPQHAVAAPLIRLLVRASHLPRGAQFDAAFACPRIKYGLNRGCTQTVDEAAEEGVIDPAYQFRGAGSERVERAVAQPQAAGCRALRLEAPPPQGCPGHGQGPFRAEPASACLPAGGGAHGAAP
jgi:hypothetical protein